MGHKKNKRSNIRDSPKSPVPNIQDILLKEYELCFTRACSMYDLTNEIIKLYTTIYFAVMSVFGFVFPSVSDTLFGNTKLLPVCMLSCLIIYGYNYVYAYCYVVCSEQLSKKTNIPITAFVRCYQSRLFKE